MVRIPETSRSCVSERKNRWELSDVFTEAMRQNELSREFQGMHYKDGLGFASTIEIANEDV